MRCIPLTLIKNAHHHDEVGTQMWSVLTSSATVCEGFETLSREYEVDAELLRKDVRRFLSELLGSGLIDVHDR